MLKLQFIYITLCSLTQAAYYSRMATVNRVRAPTAFRPGVSLQRPWTHPRLVQAASHRAPYVLYRNAPHRYAVKHYSPGAGATRNVFTAGPWKTTARLPPLSPVTPEYEFVRAASTPPHVHSDGGTGAIHTIPAPNLSLSEKPIVVIDASDSITPNSATSEAPKPTYEVTEKYSDPSIYQLATKIETPVGFSKATSLSTPELQTLVRNGAALQLASEYGLSALQLPQPHIIPQQFTMHGFTGLPSHQDLMNTGAEGIVIPPNALYQPDPMFLQKLQSQLLQRFPAVEFIPYPAPADITSPSQLQPQASQIQQQVFLLENEQITKQTPASFVPNEPQRNIVQRETHESSVVTLIPQTVVDNGTESQVEVTSASQPQNITLELVASESQPQTTTVKYILESNTEEQKTTPIYYAQVGQSVGNMIANGFYSAINDVRAAAALAQVEKPQETTNAQTENITTTTISPDLKAYFIQKPESEENTTVNELKPLLGVPFAKPADSVNVAYTLLRADDRNAKVTQEGAVYAGQIVEATISEDQDFNKEKATLLSRRPPLRLLAVTEKKDVATTPSVPPPRISIVKAKIPPKSKLTFDDKTGEPILRIYASYVDSPLQKEILASKLANIKHLKEMVTRKQDTIENWKAATVKTVDKNYGSDANQVAQFGLKLRSRSDDYIPLFEEYED